MRLVRSCAAEPAFRWVAPERRFVIVTTGRTGSELLVSLLDSHPAIRCESEILAIRRLFPTEMVLRRSAKARFQGADAYGFKLLAHHVGLQDGANPSGYLRRFHERGFKFVVLERRDWLQQAISSVRAAGTRYHYRKSDGATFSPVRLDAMAVTAALFLIEDSVTSVRSTLAEIPQLKLFYEDDLADPERQQRTADRVCAYLGLDPAPTGTDLVKLSPRNTSEQVENFDEIVTAVSGTRYARFLEAEYAAAGSG